MLTVPITVPNVSKQIHDMFADIAPRYDLANDVLSMGMHRLWRREVVRRARALQPKTILDLCCGTGDLAFALADSLPASQVFGLDFVQPMLDRAEKKQQHHRSVTFLRGDAVSIPFPDHSFDLVTIAFGIRNIPEIARCLAEIDRVLIAGGTLLILEFGQIELPVLRQLYGCYGKYVMPLIGKAVTGNREAYEYLPQTSLQFPAGARFMELLRAHSLQPQHCSALLSGLAYIYSAKTSEYPKSLDLNGRGEPSLGQQREVG